MALRAQFREDLDASARSAIGGEENIDGIGRARALSYCPSWRLMARADRVVGARFGAAVPPVGERGSGRASGQRGCDCGLRLSAALVEKLRQQLHNGLSEGPALEVSVIDPVACDDVVTEHVHPIAPLD